MLCQYCVTCNSNAVKVSGLYEPFFTVIISRVITKKSNHVLADAMVKVLTNFDNNVSVSIIVSWANSKQLNQLY